MSAPTGAVVERHDAVPRQVLVLGVVSFLTDVSSEAVFAVLPLFLTLVLGASPFVLGTMEGLADFAASSLDMASGYASDRLGKRKSIAAAGYGLSTVAKTLLVVAGSAGLVVVVRVIERLGKSIRGAPRDALLSGIAPQKTRGLSFGLHKAFDKAGAVVGPLAAYAFLDRFGESAAAFQRLFAFAVIPAGAAVAVLVLFVRERTDLRRTTTPLGKSLRALGARYRRYLACATLFSLSYFSFAFLLVAAARVGFETKQVVLLYALFNATFTAASVPIGWIGDRLGRRRLIALSYLLYAIVSVGFALASSKAEVVLLFALYGVFYAVDEGQTKAYIADLVPAELRATAIGTYGFVTAVAYLPASLLMGALWSGVAPAVAFAVAAGIALLALLAFTVVGPREGTSAT